MKDMINNMSSTKQAIFIHLLRFLSRLLASLSILMGGKSTGVWTSMLARRKP